MEHFLCGRLVEWLTAFGTVGAAMAAVWLGLRQTRVRLSATAGLATHGTAAKLYPDAGPDVLAVELANSGVIPVSVIGVYWVAGWRREEFIPVPVGPAPWPIRIPPGESYTLRLGVNDLKRSVIPSLRGAHGPTPLLAQLATGKRVRCRLTREARRWLRGAVAAMRAADRRL
jgi:hypothetical protein